MRTLAEIQVGMRDALVNGDDAAVRRLIVGWCASGTSTRRFISGTMRPA